MPRPRLIFVNRYFEPDHSATSQMLGGVARGLLAEGLQVEVVTSRQLYEDAGADLPLRETRDGLRIHRVWTTSFGRAGLAGRAIDYLTFYVSCLVFLLGLLRRDDVVVAKTDPPLISLVCAVPARLRGARLVNWLQDVFPEVAGRLAGKALPAAAERVLAGLRDAVCRGAAANVVLGERMHDHFVARGVPASRLRTIPNWADERTISPQAAATSRLREELGLGERFVVAYAGNLGRAHDHAPLLAAAELLRTDRNVHFLVVGGGAGRALLAAEVEQRRLSNFTFVPYQPQERLADMLAAADVHLVSLRRDLEGLIVPSKLYGILAAGRPAVFWGDTDGEVARELHRSQSGLSVNHDDGAGLATALLRLRDDVALRTAMGARARAAFELRYTLGRTVMQWRNLMVGLLAQPARAPQPAEALIPEGRAAAADAP